MSDEEKKAKLKEQLNVAHTLRLAQRNVETPKKEDIEKIKNVAQVYFHFHSHSFTHHSHETIPRTTQTEKEKRVDKKEKQNE